MTTSCTSCGAKMRDGYLCRSCGRELREALKDLAPGRSLLPGHALGPAGRGVSTRWDAPAAEVVGGLAGQLDTTVARLARIGDPTRGGERPVNFHERAARIRVSVAQTLQPWALWLLEMERPTPEPTRCTHRDLVGVDCRRCAVEVPKVHAARRAQWARAAASTHGGDVTAIAGYLLEHVSVLEGREEVSELLGDVTDAVRRIQKVIDRPGERIAAGECGAELGPEAVCVACGSDVDVDPDGPEVCGECGECGAEVPEKVCRRSLYADPEEAFVECPACGTRWKVAERRAWLLAEAENSIGTAATISAALTRLDQPVTADRIYQWKKRGRLVPHSYEPPPPCRDHQGRGRQPAACEACAAKEGAPLYRLGDVVDLLAEAMAAEARRAAKKAS